MNSRHVPNVATNLALSIAVSAFAAACSVAGEPPPPTPAGHETFELCQQCHGPDAMGNRAINTPAIAGLPAWYIEAQLKKFKAGGRGTHFDDLTGMQMRPMALSLATDEIIKSVADYVAALPPKQPTPLLKGGDPAKGQQRFAPCTACHGPDASGNQQLNAPPLNHASDWYLAASLEKFKAGIRGGNAAIDVTGAGMRPMAQTLPDEQAVRDVVAYITTLKK